MCIGQRCVEPGNPAADQNADSPTSAQTFYWQEFLGGTSDRLIFRRVGDQTDYVAFDRASGERRAIPPTHYTDGRWLVSLDELGQQLSVSDLDTGSQSQFAPVIAGQRFTPRFVRGSRLYGSLWRDAGALPAVIDLATGEQTVVPDNVGASAYQADGDWLAIQYAPPADLPTPPPLLAGSDPAVLSLFRTNLDAINLKTGQRIKVLATDWNANVSVRLLGVVGERVIWIELRYDSTRQTSAITLWTYRLDTGQAEAFATAFSTTQDSRMAIAAGESGVLVERSRIKGDTGLTDVSFDLYTFDGQIKTVVEALLSQTGSLSGPAFSGRLLVYQDAQTYSPRLYDNAWRIYDPDSEARRLITPFDP